MDRANRLLLLADSCAIRSVIIGSRLFGGNWNGRGDVWVTLWVKKVSGTRWGEFLVVLWQKVPGIRPGGGRLSSG
jgi:hypothetical protein